ncbi:uncharacterized protein LOC142564977 isoform X4 [Dermacentor variabilis]|uniref:uncharacterized protein LOC142564977 isoform X4 n=1 Tax=Dermacentor variabilis TaxID=34621 RepID=UPI003F5B1395
MCLCDTPGTVMLLGVFCLINNVLYLIAVFFAVQILEALAPQLATGEASAIDIACTVAFISYYGGSCLLSIGLIWGANSLNRGLLQKVVLGTKIRLVLVIFLVAFKIYVLSRADPNDPLGIDKATSIKHRSMGNDSWNLDPKTMLLQSIIYLPLAQKIPDNKPTDRKPDKKDKDDEENKPRQKVQSLVYAAAQDMLGFFLEVFIVYRLDLFVKRLPQ